VSLKHYTNDHNRIRSKEGSRNAHKSTIAATPCTQAKKRAHESKRQSHNSRTRSNLSLTNQKRGREVAELLCAQSMLGSLLSASRDHFYSPRDLGVVGASFGSFQPSLSAGAPDCPVAHRTLHSTMVRESLIGHFLSQTGTRLSNAPSNRWS
jgi:hypothetical protein